VPSLALPPIILASSSRYRQELLTRLAYNFIAIAPDIDESPIDGETAAELAQRLAIEKAAAIAANSPQALVIGSDQTLAIKGSHSTAILGKPGSHAKAVAQLEQLSGQNVEFATGLCVLSPGGSKQVAVIPTTVTFRSLTRAEIERYLEREPAFDCAGSAKVEGLGISLMERVTSDDPTALIGLPLITLAHFMRAAGYPCP
jgi:septum formation protein